MKKFLVLIILTILLVIAYPKVEASELKNELFYTDLNTKNFKDKISIDYKDIKAICCYEKCFLVKTESMDSMLEDYINKYTDNASEEEKLTAIIKGLKITKIILKD